MGMKSLKWEGIGTKNLFPHTSNADVWCCVWERDNAHAECGETNKFIGLSATIGLSAKSDQYAAETTDFYPDANPKPKP